jgi:signal transduction histidine kinase
MPKQIIKNHRAISTLAPLGDENRKAFSDLDIRYFLAIPVVSDDLVIAVIVTGRMREQRPFSPPLEASNLETVGAIGGFFGAYLARYRLIERDRQQTRDQIAEVERIVVERTTEIERQRELLNESLKRLHETQQQLIMREKLAALGQLTAGVAHEIQNPLNFINNFSELSGELVGEIREIIDETVEKLDAEMRREVGYLFVMLRSNLDKITLHGKRADSIVRNMLQHSRGDSGEIQDCNLNGIVAEAIDFAFHAARVQDPQFNIAIIRDFDPTVGELKLVPQQISRVFVNLMSNAFYALNKRRSTSDATYKPTISITSRRIDNGVELRFRDNGSGIPAHIRENIFTPFFTTKPTGEGTGLGLSLSYDIIVNGHSGGMEVDSVENQFTELTIRLPR